MISEIRDCYYRKKGKPVSESHRKSHQKVVRRASNSFHRPAKSIQRSSSTICEANSGKDVPRLYPGEEHKVILHFDSASSHTTPAVYSHFKSKKVKYIGKEDWMANSPDLSPMDFETAIFIAFFTQRKTVHSVAVQCLLDRSVGYMTFSPISILT
ncbi:hypothetical protein BV898_08511 [Hypsibius exemplaris]|uniref:Uncharacterized protein n=1 Tax=Hypsibius exemplaris TaxID=2072580 RepID=A0A1W0WQC9_HYPEX|nr:hypothetical protein BV898_08511 [Hypsibius exemplaris]